LLLNDPQIITYNEGLKPGNPGWRNQDNFFVIENVDNRKDLHLYCVLDGHGEHGMYIYDCGCMFMYMYVYVYVCLYIHIYIYIYICIYSYKHVCINRSSCITKSERKFPSTYVYMFMYMYVY
jgi:hypothetical protein